MIPAAAMLKNHTSIAGPKSAPTFSVPLRWMTNSTRTSTSEIGTIQGWAALVATPMPSTAEITEIAGVITPSPNSIAAPITTTTTNQVARGGMPFSGRAKSSARSARMPPSPSWVTRMTIDTYLMQTTMTRAQMIRERMPSTFSGSRPHERS